MNIDFLKKNYALWTLREEKEAEAKAAEGKSAEGKPSGG
jgi:hypothetical protein